MVKTTLPVSGRGGNDEEATTRRPLASLPLHQRTPIFPSLRFFWWLSIHDLVSGHGCSCFHVFPSMYSKNPSCIEYGPGLLASLVPFIHLLCLSGNTIID